MTSLIPEDENEELKTFLLEVGEVEKKHKRRLVAVLDMNHVTGLRPKMIAVKVEDEKVA